MCGQGVCQVLSVYWETFPVATTRALLSRVVGRLASDGASAMVRLGAVEGLVALLLDCPASHCVLKAMLPVRERRRGWWYGMVEFVFGGLRWLSLI